MNRRNALQLLAAAAAAPLLPAHAARPAAPLTHDDEAFLDEMQRRACLFFLEQAGEESGQVLDRASATITDGKRDPRVMASIAATGFGLTALCIADKRRYMPRAKVLDRVRKTLRFHHDKMATTHGFFTHFNDIDTGETYRHSEVSPIDTSLFLCGVLTARQYFRHDKEIYSLATDLYHNVDWPWMLNGGTTFAMGVRNGDFIKARWSHYCEHMMMYLLAIGSPTHPIDPACWDAWTRPTTTFGDITYIGAKDPLFVHQYSHAWFDFRNKRDKYANYFLNSVLATRAHEAWCLSLGKPYSQDYWGVSASDTAHGYRAWGGPPGEGNVDGSVVPYTTAGSLPFLAADCMRVQRSLKDKFGDRAWGRYGFCDAFHPDADWYDKDVLGIDLGISVVMAENARSGFVWEVFQRNPEVKVAFERTGFHADVSA